MLFPFGIMIIHQDSPNLPFLLIIRYLGNLDRLI